MNRCAAFEKTYPSERLLRISLNAHRNAIMANSNVTLTQIVASDDLKPKWTICREMSVTSLYWHKRDSRWRAGTADKEASGRNCNE